MEKLLKLINWLSKILKCKIHILKNELYFLTLRNEQPKNKIKKTAAFTIISERIKYSHVGNNLIKMCHTYSENYKTLLKEIKVLNKCDNLF